MEKILETDEPQSFIDEVEKLQEALPKRVNANSSNAEKGLAKLVLTLIDFIRKLLEKQAMRRIEAGSLSEAEIERLGETFMKLEKKMEDLKKQFGLEGEELNLPLGPMGKLM